MFASAIATPLAYIALVFALFMFIMSPRLVVRINKPDQVLQASQQLMTRWSYLYCFEVCVALCVYISLVLLGVIASLPFVTALCVICGAAFVLSCMLSSYV